MRDLIEQNNDAKAANDQEVRTEQTEQPNPINDDSLQKSQTKEPDQPGAENETQGKSQEANPPSSQSDDTYFEVETLLKMKYIRQETLFSTLEE